MSGALGLRNYCLILAARPDLDIPLLLVFVGGVRRGEMIQLILHLIGDYITQSDWMAQNKTKESLPAFCHALVYALPFLLLTRSPLAWGVIFGTHFLIDRFRLARYVVWAKNWLAPWKRRETRTEALQRAKSDGRVSSPVFQGTELGDFLDDYDNNPRYIYATPSWDECEATGYPPDLPAWLAVWLLIIADNTIHLATNYAALRWL